MGNTKKTETENKTKKSRGPYKTKSPSRGGPRPNAGRPKGSTNKLTAATLLDEIEKVVGTSFENSVAQGYKNAITNNDTQLRYKYESTIISKVIADKQEIDHTTMGHMLQPIIQFYTKETGEWGNEKD